MWNAAHALGKQCWMDYTISICVPRKWPSDEWTLCPWLLSRPRSRFFLVACFRTQSLSHTFSNKHRTPRLIHRVSAGGGKSSVLLLFAPRRHGCRWSFVRLAWISRWCHLVWYIIAPVPDKCVGHWFGVFEKKLNGDKLYSCFMHTIMLKCLINKCLSYHNLKPLSLYLYFDVWSFPKHLSVLFIILCIYYSALRLTHIPN